MTRKLTLGIVAALGLSITLLAQSALEVYQRALVQEQAAGNLREAIQLYKRAAREAGADRALAARALIRAAGSQEKLGEPQAAESYAEVLRTYSEQREQVAIAQARLAALRPTSPSAVQNVTAPSARPDVPAVAELVVETYCASCHNQTRNSANLNLEAIIGQSVADNTAVWERVLRRTRARLDPPPGTPRPGEGTFQAMISTLEAALDQSYPAAVSMATAPRITDMELADRMAAFIWSGKPDATLTDVAKQGRLRDPAVLEQQVRRMLRDSRSTGLVANFLERWMLSDGLEKLASADSRSSRFPGFDEDLRQGFARETRLFLESQLREDHNALDLWTANYTFVNERLARHYGIANVSGAEFRRVNLPDSARAGIMGHGSLLTVTSLADRTSPTIRGKTILKLFTGTFPPDPPPNVPALRAGTSGAASSDRPMRERLAQHLAVPACVSCHRLFDPLGLALENFNPIGAWQTTFGGLPIDASGAFVDGTAFDGPAELRAGLLRYRDAYYNSMTQSMLGYALARQGTAWRVYEHEMPSVRAVVRDAATNEYRWSSIVLGIVKSTPFQLKNVVP